MNAMVSVIAQEGTTCPRENPRDPKINSEPVLVQYNVYYRRLIADGSLRLAPSVQEDQVTDSKKKNGGGK